MTVLKTIEIGEWESHPNLLDYRAEWPGDMLVERATWSPDAPTETIHFKGVEPIAIGGPGFIWFRFWLADEDQLVERYFDADGHPIGMYMPICMELEHRAQSYSTVNLLLALWLQADGGRLMVLNEDRFDQAVADGLITPVQSERAENRIRELTRAIFQKRFPPALVRNFTISVTSPDDTKEE